MHNVWISTENIYSSDATFVPKYKLSGIAIVDNYDNDSEIYHILFTDVWLPLVTIVNFKFCGLLVGCTDGWCEAIIVVFWEL